MGRRPSPSRCQRSRSTHARSHATEEEDGLKIFALALFAGGLAVAPPAFSQVHKEAVVQDIAPIVADTFRDRGDGVLWEGRVSAPRAFYVRLRFSEITSPPDAAYAVVVRKANGETLTRY